MVSRKFTSVNTGKIFESIDDYWLIDCPICGHKLLWNSYSDKYVSGNDNSIEISFDLKIEHCEKCNDFYVHII